MRPVRIVGGGLSDCQSDARKGEPSSSSLNTSGRTPDAAAPEGIKGQEKIRIGIRATKGVLGNLALFVCRFRGPIVPFSDSDTPEPLR
jgi:hypothetical protein